MKILKKLNEEFNQKGIAILLAIIILSVVSLIAVLIATVVNAQLKLSGDINDSTAAIYAADSGIEWQLYNLRQGVTVAMPTMSNGAILSVTTTGSYPNFTIKSLGSYRSAKRQFQVNF